MPELAIAFTFGAMTTTVVLIIALIRENIIAKSSELRMLQQNLSLIQKRWSNSADKVVDQNEKEGLSFFKSMLIFGVFCIFLSWFGLIFFCLIYFSIQLMKNPQKKILLTSQLAVKPHLPEETLQIVNTLLCK